MYYLELRELSLNDSDSFHNFIHLAVSWTARIDVNRGYVIMLALFPLNARYVKNFLRGTLCSLQRRGIARTASAAFISIYLLIKFNFNYKAM